MTTLPGNLPCETAVRPSLTALKPAMAAMALCGSNSCSAARRRESIMSCVVLPEEPVKRNPLLMRRLTGIGEASPAGMPAKTFMRPPSARCGMAWSMTAAEGTRMMMSEKPLGANSLASLWSSSSEILFGLTSLNSMLRSAAREASLLRRCSMRASSMSVTRILEGAFLEMMASSTCIWPMAPAPPGNQAAPPFRRSLRRGVA